jgi:hypothetical protein
MTTRTSRPTAKPTACLAVGVSLTAAGVNASTETAITRNAALGRKICQKSGSLGRRATMRTIILTQK